MKTPKLNIFFKKFIKLKWNNQKNEQSFDNQDCTVDFKRTHEEPMTRRSGQVPATLVQISAEPEEKQMNNFVLKMR